MKKNIYKIVLLSSFALIVFYSCTKDDSIEVSDIEETIIDSPAVAAETIEDLNKQVLKYLLSLGYSMEDINERADSYVVGGDIVFPKNFVVPLKDKLEGLDDHRFVGIPSLITFNLSSNIRVMVDPSMNARIGEINSAIAIWNNSNSNVRFVIIPYNAAWVAPLNLITTTQPVNYDILIRDFDLLVGPGFITCGEGFFPSNNRAGYLINIDIDAVQSHSLNQRIINIVHELGHTIGFRHTNETTGGVTVPGFPGQDANSIMNGSMCGQLQTSLSGNDIGAIRTLYPKTHPTPSNVKIETDYGQFKFTWANCSSCYHNAIENIVSYSGNVSNSPYFGASVTLAPSSTSYVVPNATPNPSVDGNYIGVTVRSRCIHGTYSAQTVGKQKSGGVWQ